MCSNAAMTMHGDIWAAKLPSLRSLRHSSAAADWRDLKYLACASRWSATYSSRPTCQVRGGFSRRISSASVRANKAHSGRWRPIGRCKGSVKSRAARRPRAISEAKRSSNQRACARSRRLPRWMNQAAVVKPTLATTIAASNSPAQGMVLVAAPSKVAK